MQKLPRRQIKPGAPPHVPETVLEYLENSPDAPSEDAMWAKLGVEQGPMVRRALQRADELRAAGADPGDAYLAGIREAYAAIGEQMMREEFVRAMFAGPAAKNTA